jgi:putative ABC transport system permease protein
MLREFLTRLRFFLSRKRPADLDDELQFHLEQCARENVAKGMTPQEARRQAAIAFGGVQRTREQCYEQRPGWQLERLFQDTRYVLRRLKRAPTFTAIALVTLALGIGATTAIFSVVEGVLIKPLPYPQAESLVGVWHTAPGMKGIGDGLPCSPAMYFTYREESRTFQNFGLYARNGATVTGLGEPDVVPTLVVTYGTLQALGVQPKLGRWFSQADDTPGTPETVILNYGYWQRRFGADPAVVGRTLTIDQHPRTVIGVMPSGFDLKNNQPDLILPQRLERNKAFLGQFGWQAIARLRPGVTLQQANADQARMIAIWLKAWPPAAGFSRDVFERAGFGPKLQPFKQEVVGNIGTVLWVLMGTIGVVLLIACANVANLLLVRAESRQHEMAIRAALGAGWKTIAREMLLESAVLGLLGGSLGIGLAYGALRILVVKGPQTLPRLNEIGIDPLVLGFALGISLLAGLLFGLIPVLKYAAPEIATDLRGVGRSFSQGRERHRARNTLVVVQVGLALLLLVGAGLMIRTFQFLRSVEPGFARPEELQLMRILTYPEQVKEPEKVMRMQNAMLDKLAAIPGVTSAAFASDAPLEGLGGGDALYAEDKTYNGQIPPVRQFRSVTPGFFKTTGTAMIAGRDFTWTDLYQLRRVAIVSENLAREVWGSPSAALGKRVRSGFQNDPWKEVVGVVADVYDKGPQEKPPTFAYWPAMMDHFEGEDVNVPRFTVFLVRTKRAATESFLTEARRAIWSVNADLPVFRVQTLKDLYDISMARTSFTLVMLAIAGGMALLLGIVGIYGVIAYAVSQRTREIGIRVALGARAAELQRMFVREALLLAGIGAALGMIAAAGLTRLMSSLLFGITPLDPLTYATVPVFLLAAAALASYVPARRATIVNPVEALRSE